MPSKITHAVTVAASMALAACAIQSTTASTPEQETHAMTATDSGSQAIKPKVTAEQVLLRVLELIRTSKTIQDFTPEKLTEVMELKLYFADGGNQYGAGQVLTPQWGYRFEFDRVSMYGPFFSFDFYEHPKDTNWSMTDICQMDTERFSTELESMGYTRQTKYGLHGSLDGYEFGGRGPGVTVYTRGESNENAGHRCIRMIEIR